MSGLLRIPIEGAGSVLVEGETVRGPISAGRVTDAVEDAAHTFQTALVPIKDAAKAVLEQLKEAKPDEIEVEFGVELTAETGAVITRIGGACHLTLKLTWKKEMEKRPPDLTVGQVGE